MTIFERRAGVFQRRSEQLPFNIIPDTMDQQLKQRLVGVAVIFSLAVIFIPMLLDGAGTRPEPVQVDIPEKPVIEPFDVVQPKIIELQKQAAEIPPMQARIVDEISDPPNKPTPAPVQKTTTVATKTTPVAKSTKKAATQTRAQPRPVAKPTQKSVAQTKVSQSNDKSPLAKAVSAAKKLPGGNTWIIQAGSFNDKGKAYRLRDKLRKSRLANDVFIEKFRHGAALSYRVRLGMFLTRKKADIVANKLRAKFNIKGLVQKYDK